MLHCAAIFQLELVIDDFANFLRVQSAFPQKKIFKNNILQCCCA